MAYPTQYGKNGELAFPGNGKQRLTPQEEEIRRLKKEFYEVRQERDILKKVVAIFSKKPRIALIDGFLCKSPAKSRLEGYKKALNKYRISLDESLISVGDINIEDGYERTKQMLEKNLDFTAIFAYNDMMAFGSMQAIKEKGLRIPEDIGLVGYDDILFCSLMDPALTTIRLKKQELGTESVKLLLSRINGNRKKAKKIMLDVELQIRES